MARFRTAARVAAAGLASLVAGGWLGACDRSAIKLLDDSVQSSSGAAGDGGLQSKPPVSIDQHEYDSGPEPGGSEGCTMDTECSSEAPRCDPVEQLCVECVDSTHCDGWTPQCDTASHRCVQCVDATDCPKGMICDALSTRCEVPCASDASCLFPRPLCDTSRWVCVECRTDADCSRWFSGAFCAAGSCTQCLDDSDCGDDRPFCNTRTRTCELCVDDHHCPAGSHCDPFDRICR